MRCFFWFLFVVSVFFCDGIIVYISNVFLCLFMICTNFQRFSLSFHWFVWFVFCACLILHIFPTVLLVWFYFVLCVIFEISNVFLRRFMIYTYFQCFSLGLYDLNIFPMFCVFLFFILKFQMFFMSCMSWEHMFYWEILQHIETGASQGLQQCFNLPCQF